MTTELYSHETVLLQQAVTGVLNDPEGIYVDGTFGRGGHSRLLLEHLADKATLLAIDKDPEALKSAAAITDPRFQIAHGSFADIKALVSQYLGPVKLSGVLLDLGVSSPQLDDEQRGFSFMKEGPLDMRMDTSRGLSASEWLYQTDEKEIAKVLKEYGEERFAKRIANWVVKAQQDGPIETTTQLAKIIAEATPKKDKHKHPATRSFQAIRIAVNSELDDLKKVLSDSFELLKVGGRLAVISFHSLEDRMVKQFIREQEQGQNFPPGLPVTEDQILRRMKKVGKAIKATPEEVKVNPRSRSAILRVAEKLND